MGEKPSQYGAKMCTYVAIGNYRMLIISKLAKKWALRHLKFNLYTIL